MSGKGRQIVSRKWSIANGDGFTLIELLVVIAIIMALMAVLFPVLARARKQARAVACRSILHQWGVSVAAVEHDNVVSTSGRDITRIGRDLMPGFTGWGGEPDCQLLCPSARTPLPGRPTGIGDAFHPHCLSRVDDTGINEPLYSSYGHNGWLGQYSPGWRRIWDVRTPSRTPVYFDSAMRTVEPDNASDPPEHEICTPEEKMSPVCINRHSGGINMLFLDFSVRQVGLKEHWTFQWNREFNTTGRWTKAGGVLPEAWPQWMRRFKDY